MTSHSPSPPSYYSSSTSIPSPSTTSRPISSPPSSPLPTSPPPQPRSPFVLRRVTPSDVQTVFRALWDWEICSKCLADPSAEPSCSRGCDNPSDPCPWSLRSARLEPWVDWYKRVTAGYAPDFFGDGTDDDCQALRGHADLADLILSLRRRRRQPGNLGDVSSRWLESSDGTVSEAEIMPDDLEEEEKPQLRVPGRSKIQIPESDRERALRLAWKVMTMCELDIGTQVEGIGGKPVGEDGVWCEVFPMRRHPSLDVDSKEGETIRAGLAADQLARVGGLKFKGTDELENHLKLDQERGEVLIYGWATVLKEGLLAGLSQEDDDDETFVPLERNTTRGAYLQRSRGQCIPRPLALETLHTYHLLFPPSNPKSQRLLRSLVDKNVFPDPDILQFGTSPYEASPKERHDALQFPIWGSRLLDLYDEVENPRPRGRMESWLERRSKSRHVMMATIAGVGAAVVLGVLGLGVAIFQTWISWQEFKLESSNRGNLGED